MHQDPDPVQRLDICRTVAWVLRACGTEIVNGVALIWYYHCILFSFLNNNYWLLLLLFMTSCCLIAFVVLAHIVMAIPPLKRANQHVIRT